MTKRGLIAIGLSLAILPATPALAQMASGGARKSDKMSSGAMAMSKGDMAMMKKCQKMSHAMMMKDARCASMMKAHPDMMKSGMMAH